MKNHPETRACLRRTLAWHTSPRDSTFGKRVRSRSRRDDSAPNSHPPSRFVRVGIGNKYRFLGFASRPTDFRVRVVSKTFLPPSRRPTTPTNRRTCAPLVPILRGGRDSTARGRATRGWYLPRSW